jgi:hypothetical protein
MTLNVNYGLPNKRHSIETVFLTIDRIIVLCDELKKIEKSGSNDALLWGVLAELGGLLHAFFGQFLWLAHDRPEIQGFATRFVGSGFSTLEERVALYINPVPDIDVKHFAAFVNETAEPVVIVLKAIRNQLENEQSRRS